VADSREDRADAPMPASALYGRIPLSKKNSRKQRSPLIKPRGLPADTLSVSVKLATRLGLATMFGQIDDQTGGTDRAAGGGDDATAGPGPATNRSVVTEWKTTPSDVTPAGVKSHGPGHERPENRQ